MAIYEHRVNGYSGRVPDLPACLATGIDLREVRIGLRGAVNEYVAGLQGQVENLPDSVSWILNCPRPSQGHGIDHWVVEAVEIAT